MPRRRAQNANESFTKTIAQLLPEDEDFEPDFCKPDHLSPHLTCSICQEIFRKPLRAPCGHSFCSKCILQWLSQKKECPEDRKRLTENMLHHDFIVDNLIGDIKVYCRYRKNGCKARIQLAALKSHSKECAFNPEVVPSFILNADEPPSKVPKCEVSSSSQQSEEPESSSDEESEKENSDDDLDGPLNSLRFRLFKAGGDTRNHLLDMFNEIEQSNS